jgi:hypothetical protein
MLARQAPCHFNHSTSPTTSILNMTILCCKGLTHAFNYINDLIPIVGRHSHANFQKLSSKPSIPPVVESRLNIEQWLFLSGRWGDIFFSFITFVLIGNTFNFPLFTFLNRLNALYSSVLQFVLKNNN